MKSTPFAGLYAHVRAPAAPAVSLARRERRRPWEGFPTVPAAGLEWAPGEVAAALFEAGADEMAVPVPTTDALYAAFRASVEELGPAGVAEVVECFNSLDEAEFPEVGACRTFAYRLALSFWYEGARSRLMTAGEAAVALYLSDAYRHPQANAYTLHRAPLPVSRAIRQGAGLVPVEALIRLGAAMVREFAGPATPGHDWLYRQALPDWRRRRFCFDLMRADTRQPCPLIVRLDGGDHVVGATAPAGPDGTWPHSLRARW